jgi:hypothetical protein
VPGRGFATASGRFGNSPGRLTAGLPGAGCPGSGALVRCHEARDRTEPRPRGFWREPRWSAGRRAAPTRQVCRLHACLRWAASARLLWRRRPGGEADTPFGAPFGAPPPLFAREALLLAVQQSSGAHASRERTCLSAAAKFICRRESAQTVLHFATLLANPARAAAGAPGLLAPPRR